MLFRLAGLPESLTSKDKYNMLPFRTGIGRGPGPASVRERIQRLVESQGK